MGALVASNTLFFIGLLALFGIGIYAWLSFQRPYVAFLILVFFALNESLSGLSIGSVSLMVLVGFVFAFTWAVQLATHRARFLGVNEYWVLVGLAGILIISSVMNWGGQAGTRPLLTYIQQIFLVVLLVNFVTTPEKLRTLGIIAILSSLSIALPMVVAKLFGISPYSLGIGYSNSDINMNNRLFGYFSDPNFTGGQLILAIPFLVELWPGMRKRSQRILLLVALGIILLAFLYTYSIGGLVGLLIYLLVKIVVISPHNGIVKLLRVALVTGAVVFTYIVLFPPLYQAKIQENIATVANFVITGNSASFSEIGTARGQAWLNAFQAIEASPILGYGPGNGMYAAVKYATNPIDITSPAHNMFLGVALDMGLLGSGLFIYLFIAAGLATMPHLGDKRKSYHPLLSATKNAIFGGIIICLVMGMGLDFNLIKYPWALIGMALIYKRIAKSNIKKDGDV
jgi:hypothetical protein